MVERGQGLTVHYSPQVFSVVFTTDSRARVDCELYFTGVLKSDTLCVVIKCCANAPPPPSSNPEQRARDRLRTL